MSSDLTTGPLAAAAEPGTLTPVSELHPVSLIDAPAVRITPEGTSDAAPALPPDSIPGRSTGLRARLLVLDVAAVVTTWVAVGAFVTPGVSASRRLGAAGLAIRGHSGGHAVARALPIAALHST